MKKNYRSQKKANIESFLKEEEYKERKEAFFRIIGEFEKANLGYSLACSFNLFLRGVSDDFHDFDFIIEKKDSERVKDVVEKLGAKLVATGGNGYCESLVYMHFQYGRVDFEVIAGFQLLTFGSRYLYEYNSEQLDYVDVDDVSIPLTSMEALFILYYMMEGWQTRRKYKRKLIYEYLVNQDVKYPQILEDALEDPLPYNIKRDIKILLMK